VELIDRYLQAVKFWLPRGQQDDIAAELSEDMQSQIEEQESKLGRQLNEGEVAQLLKQRGRPLLVASRYLPQAIVARKKHGFAVPIGTLIRTLFRERCRDVLLSRSNPVADWFDRAAIEALISDHDRGQQDHGKVLWTLYILFCVAQRQWRVMPGDAAEISATATAY